MTAPIAELGLELEFATGEEPRTEFSAKFTRARLEANDAAVLRLDRWFLDADSPFALSLAAHA